MTARVCPVHGEYAADGVCRWCEKPQAEPPLPERLMYLGAKVVLDPHSDRDGPVYVSWTFAYEDAPVAAPEGYGRTEAFIDAETHAAEEARLLAQHAALRWERVARRWATKAKFDGHERTVDGTLTFDDRCAECRRLGHRGNRIAALEPKP